MDIISRTVFCQVMTLNDEVKLGDKNLWKAWEGRSQYGKVTS